MRVPTPSVSLSLAKLIVPVHSLGRHRVEASSMFSVEVSFKFTLLCICYMDFVSGKKKVAIVLQLKRRALVPQ